MANTSVGEIGIDVDGREFLLRPSFANVARVGTPEEIVLDFHHICAAFEVEMGGDNWLKCTGAAGSFDTAKHIIECCLSGSRKQRKEDAEFLCGSIDYDAHDDYSKAIPKGGALPSGDVIKLGFAMLRYGVAGKPHSKLWKRGNTDEELKSFDPSELVGIAISHFNMPPESAWNMTMIEYQRAWEGKFPEEKEKESPPTKQEAKKCFEWAREQMEKAKTHGVVKRTGARKK